MKLRILSGVQPSGNGRLHIGNYLGALKNLVALQNSGDYECFCMIADYHSITEDFVPADKKQQILNTSADFLSAGLDPQKSTIFLQSQVPQHVELAWIFDTITPVSELERMTQYKDKAARQKTNINAGLLTYPVLQAADILIYKPAGVPVGRDQEQHLELTRKMVRWFNKKFGDTFKEPKTLLTDAPKVMSLLEPEKKMSKSLGDKHCVYLSDEPDTIASKIARAVTASAGGDKDMPAGVANLFLLLENFGSTEMIKQYKQEYKLGSIQYKDLKAAVSQAVSEYFSDFRSKRARLMSDSDTLWDTLETGAQRARVVADRTLQEAKQKIGIPLT